MRMDGQDSYKFLCGWSGIPDSSIINLCHGCRVGTKSKIQNLKNRRKMASAGSMKGFYRQKKNPKTSSKAKSSSKSKKSAVSFGSAAAQPPALVSHGGIPDLQDDYCQSEEMLQQFDMNMAYGPCLGMTRLARWERAHKLGLNPPAEIERLLKSGKVQAECLWDGRI